MASRKIINKNVSSSATRVSSEMLAELKRLRLVSRFHNARAQHGNQRAQAWNFFGFLFYDTAAADDQVQPQHSGDLSDTVRTLVHRMPQANWKQLESDVVRCALCLLREQKSFEDRKGRLGHQ